MGSRTDPGDPAMVCLEIPVQGGVKVVEEENHTDSGYAGIFKRDTGVSAGLGVFPIRLQENHYWRGLENKTCLSRKGQ